MRTFNDDGYGLAPRSWSWPSAADTGGAQASPTTATTNNNTTEAACRTIDPAEVEVIALALAQRRFRLPSGSTVSGEGIAHRATHVTLWPLAPMTVEAAIRSNLIDIGGVRWGNYEAAVQAMQDKEQRR